MSLSVVNFKLDSAVKRKAQRKAEKLGMSLSTALNLLIRKFLRIDNIDFIEEEEGELTDWAKEQLRQSEEDIKKGYVSPTFKTMEEELAWLKDPNARYKNGRRVR